MYQKYNAVLRAKSKSAFLMDAWRKLCKGNTYVSTIHAINSAIIKLSKLTPAAVVYRGISHRALPQRMKQIDELNVRGAREK